MKELYKVSSKLNLSGENLSETYSAVVDLYKICELTIISVEKIKQGKYVRRRMFTDIYGYKKTSIGDIIEVNWIRKRGVKKLYGFDVVIKNKTNGWQYRLFKNMW